MYIQDELGTIATDHLNFWLYVQDVWGTIATDHLNFLMKQAKNLNKRDTLTKFNNAQI